ncbi:MAG TPA: hypothetical protein VFO16_08440 [Pseudonocardiaceae bacterium]|nr:hypothetical protein [Pseudonocardiaceae bacterium]
MATVTAVVIEQSGAAYHDLPIGLRELVDQRCAALLKNPTADPDAV